MSKMRLVALTVAALAFGVGTASAVDIDGKKGLGYAQAIGGPAGLAFNFGTGNLDIEAILGVAYFSPDGDNKGLEAGNAIGLGAGVHFHALRAENASLTVGGRINLGFGAPEVAGNSAKVKDSDTVTQFGIDIPVRVYWFPDKHVSLHAEMGISVVMDPEKGSIFKGGAGPKGTSIYIFNGPAANGFGNLGLTFWW